MIHGIQLSPYRVRNPAASKEIEGAFLLTAHGDLERLGCSMTRVKTEVKVENKSTGCDFLMRATLTDVRLILNHSEIITWSKVAGLGR